MPILRLYSVTSDAVSISWTVPAGSVVDSYDVQWQVHFETRSTFHVTLSPTSFNNYTVTGLESYSNNVTLSIAVIAYNAAGNETSPSVNVAVGFVNQESSKGNNAAIVGAVVGGCVVLAIAVVTVVLLIYHYWSRDKRYCD